MTFTTLTRWKIVGWMPALGCTAAVGIGLLITLSPGPASSIFPFSYRVVDTIVPLFFGLQAAFLLSPETEPSLEILLSSQLPLSKVLWERFFILALFGGAVALSGNQPAGWF